MHKNQAILKLKSLRLHIILDDMLIYGILWKKQDLPSSKLTKKQEKILKKLKDELELYLKGELKVFSSAFKLEGTDFQLRVWSELQKIPYAKTISYKELAIRLGDKNASRAVGTANSKNPISILVPCHRVIRTNGEYGGYAGGESLKESLIKLELKYLT